MAEPQMVVRELVPSRKRSKDPRPRDPVTGRLLPNLRPNLEAEAVTLLQPESVTMPQPEPKIAPKPFVPVRCWTAGPGMPQEKIYVPELGSAGLRPIHDGSYILNTPEKLAVAKRALGRRFWPDTVPEDEPSPRCEVCQWECRSYAAMNFHQNHAHGRQQ